MFVDTVTANHPSTIFLYNPEAARHASKRIFLFTASGEVERGPSPTLLSSQTYKDIAMLVGLYIINF